jgi:predicted lipid-binding transport protein (Tim44 family)
MSGLMGGLGGLLIGGLIGSMLFGGLGHGLGGGLGLIELLLMAGLAYFAFSWFRKRQAPAPASPAGYAPAPGGYAPAPSEWRPEPVARAAAVAEAPAAPSDLDQGVSYIRQMDASFDPRRFGETATDIFFKVQAAWMTRDMGSARPVLTEEMLATMQRDCDRLRSERRINRLENIAVRSVDVTEAWQERGQDFVTVGFVANLLDYTTDESGTQVLEGSRTEPVKFEEFWTFTRPVGPSAWKLSAIQQSSQA